VTEFVNLKIKPAQSFRGAHRDMIYVHVSIVINAYMSIYAFTIFLKKNLWRRRAVAAACSVGCARSLPPRSHLSPPTLISSCSRAAHVAAPSVAYDAWHHLPLLPRATCRSCATLLKAARGGYPFISLSLSHDQHRPDHLASLSDVKLKLRASITTHSDERHRGYPAAFLPSAPSWSDPLLLLLEQDSPEPSSPCR
jgi:hypothetical protein